MELTMTIDGMEPFVKATYVLEGDGLLAFIAYERISTLYSTAILLAIIIPMSQQLLNI